MATLDQIAQALKTADAAGDTQSAQQLAQAYKQMSAGAPPQSQYSPLEQQLISSGKKTPAQIDALHKADSLQSQAQAFNPNSDMSFGQQVLANAGQTAANTGLGIKQVSAKLADFLDPRAPTLSGVITQADPSRSAAVQQEVDQARQQDAPLLNTAGAPAGQILGYGAQALLPGGVLKGAGAVSGLVGAGRIAQVLGAAGDALLVPRTAKTAAAIGAAQAALQPVGTGDSRLLNAAEGAGVSVLGQQLPRVVGALSAPVSQATKDLAQKAQQLGIQITPAQLSDSTFVKTLRSVVGKFPLSGADATSAAQAGQYNSAIAKTLGQTLDPKNPVITPDVMAAAKTRLGGMFNKAASYGVPVDAQFGNALTAVRDEAAQVLTPDQMAPLQKQISNIFNKVENGQISGQTYQALTSKGSPLSRALSGTDPNVKFYAGKIKDVLNDAMARNGTAEQKALLAEARPQYKALKTIEPLVNKSPSGNISPALLLNKVAKKTPSMAYGGGGDLADLGRIGQAFLKDSLPDSGTAQRVGIQNLLLGLSKPAEVGGAALAGHALGFSTPMTAAGLVGTMGAARTIRAILDNPKLANAILRRGPDAGRNLVQALQFAQPAERTLLLQQQASH